MVLRRVAVVLSALVLAGTGAVVAVAEADDAPRTPVAVERAHRFYLHGPTAEYEYDAGAIGTVEPLLVHVAPGTPVTGVVEVSFEYRTFGPGPFDFSLGVREPGVGRARVRAPQVWLPAADQRTPMTVRFLVPDLLPDRDYELQVSANSVFPPDGRNEIHTRRVLLTLDLTRQTP